MLYDIITKDKGGRNMEIDRQKLTPMMKQYFECKDKYPDCILFFRLGDFYEMFFEDAIVASKVLERHSKKRSNSSSDARNCFRRKFT